MALRFRPSTDLDSQMAPVSTARTVTHARSIGFDVWMDRVPARAKKVRSDWEPEDVHDLRVALRRSRTMAEALNEVNPGHGWQKLKKSTRGIFHTLGELRDVQVERERLKELSPSGDILRTVMLRRLARQEKACRAGAEQALDEFDSKEWKKLARKLSPKSRFFPPESVVFQRLALGRLNEATELYQKVRQRESSVALHRLRKGLKNFRYIVENFLPQRYEVWGSDLKRLQDLLGNIHDLDVLRGDIRKNISKRDPALVAQWMQRIERERKNYLREFRAKTSGQDSPWLTWRAGFQWGHVLVAAPAPQRQIA
jgi:CHAD domain-containing protein